MKFQHPGFAGGGRFFNGRFHNLKGHFFPNNRFFVNRRFSMTVAFPQSPFLSVQCGFRRIRIPLRSRVPLSLSLLSLLSLPLLSVLAA